MEKIPRSTPTKEDKLKELHDIQLKINEENAILEKVTRDRKEAEKGFAAREKKCSDREAVLNERENSHDRVIQEKQDEVKRLDDLIAMKNGIHEGIVQDIDESESTLKSSREKNEKVLGDQNITIESNKSQIILLNKEISDKKEEIAQLDADIEVKSEELEDTIQSVNNKLDELKNEEDRIDEKGKELERQKSAIRTYSVRFHQQFEGKLSERIIKETTIEE